MMGGPFYGTAIVFTPPGRWDETTHLELTAKHRIATWTGVPTMYWRLLEHPDFESYDLTCVTAISSGGAPFPPELIRLLQETFPGVGVSQGYGASETMGGGHAVVRPADGAPSRRRGARDARHRHPDP